MATLQERIDKIEGILDSGVTEAMVDGQKVRYNHDMLRKRLAELKAQQGNAGGAPVVRQNTYGSALGGN